MNWLPTFSNWTIAAGAAAVAIPTLLLLYFLKLRRQERTVPSTILWKKAVQDLQVNSPFQKLRRNLLLLLQMLILLALLVALSNPITFFKPPAGAQSVILIDRSASMSARDVDGHSRLEEAKRQATALVDSMGRGARAMVIAFDDSAETVQPLTSDQPALRNAINSIQQTDRPTNPKLAYQLADAQVQTVEGGQSTTRQQQSVYIYSDGRFGGEEALSMRGEPLYEPVGSETAKNIGIVAFSARRNYERPTEVQVFARLANFGPQPADTDVQLSVSTIDPDAPAADRFEVRQVRSGLHLLPERWTDKQREEAEQQGNGNRGSVEFTLDLSTAAVIKLEQMDKADDVLPQDDAAMVVIPPPKPLNVALVTDGNYFLERAVSSLNIQKPKILSPADWERTRPADLDLMFFDRYVPRYMPTSGNFVWFGAMPDDLELKQSKDAQGRGLFMNDVEVLDWKRDHPMLRYLSLGKLFVAEAMRLDVPLQSEVLIEGTTGPLLVLHRQGKSIHLVCAFDVLQSNWPLRVSFPIFINNAVQFIAVGSNLSVRESFRPGATPKIPKSNIDRAAEGAQEITLVGPGGARQRLPVPAGGDFALPPLDKVGLYRLDPVVPQYERLAVNLLNENESNTFTERKEAPGQVGRLDTAAGGRAPLQLWWWILACVGVPLLLIEWWVYTRRVHA